MNNEYVMPLWLVLTILFVPAVLCCVFLAAGDPEMNLFTKNFWKKVWIVFGLGKWENWPKINKN